MKKTMMLCYQWQRKRPIAEVFVRPLAMARVRGLPEVAQRRFFDALFIGACDARRGNHALTYRRIKGESARVAKQLQFDEIGQWSEIKLEILKEYATAYSTILAAQKRPPFHHVYIEGFAGAGMHLTKVAKDFVLGSPLNALRVAPPFREYHLVDIAPDKVQNLRRMIGTRDDVFIYPGDCNQILLKKVFPRVRYDQYHRGLCVLDPYGLDLDWKVISTAGQMKSLDMFLNFPVQAINRSVLWREPDGVDETQIARMTAFWGDASWRDHAYRVTRDLFSNLRPEKESNQVIAQAFRERLKEIAGFQRVPDPLPMRNSKGSIVYYLFFASAKNTAENIVLDIFSKYRKRGG
jgi:three-Cys-motif partner protein